MDNGGETDTETVYAWLIGDIVHSTTFTSPGQYKPLI